MLCGGLSLLGALGVHELFEGGGHVEKSAS